MGKAVGTGNQRGGRIEPGPPRSEADKNRALAESRLRKLRKERVELLGVWEETGKMIQKIDREILGLELHPDGFRWF